VQTYTVLTVGDGLVTQIPALIVSTAAGLLVTKAGGSGAADQALITASAEALPKAYERLGNQIGTPARRGRAVRVPPGSRMLLNGDIDALIRLMYPILGGWAARVRAVPGLSLARHGHPPGSLEAVAADCRVLFLHTVPMLALADGPMARTWTWRAGTPMPPELEEQIADLEINFIGDGWVRAVTDVDGTTAGHDILDLHRAAVKLLGETPAPLLPLHRVPRRDDPRRVPGVDQAVLGMGKGVGDPHLPPVRPRALCEGADGMFVEGVHMPTRGAPRGLTC
jgi:hypothetical protein